MSGRLVVSAKGFTGVEHQGGPDWGTLARSLWNIAMNDDGISFSSKWGQDERLARVVGASKNAVRKELKALVENDWLVKVSRSRARYAARTVRERESMREQAAAFDAEKEHTAELVQRLSARGYRLAPYGGTRVLITGTELRRLLAATEGGER